MAEKKKSTSPGPHGMKITIHDSGKKPIDRFKPIKKESRAILLPIRKAAKGPSPIKDAAAEVRAEASSGKTPKARKLTRLMRKGYRKGYRVKSTRGGSRR